MHRLLKKIGFARTLPVGRAAQTLHIQLHQPLSDILNHLPQKVGVGALFSELGECHSGLGSRRDTPL